MWRQRRWLTVRLSYASPSLCPSPLLECGPGHKGRHQSNKMRQIALVKHLDVAVQSKHRFYSGQSAQCHVILLPIISFNRRSIRASPKGNTRLTCWSAVGREPLSGRRAQLGRRTRLARQRRGPRICRAHFGIRQLVPRGGEGHAELADGWPEASTRR